MLLQGLAKYDNGLWMLDVVLANLCLEISRACTRNGWLAACHSILLDVFQYLVSESTWRASPLAFAPQVC